MAIAVKLIQLTPPRIIGTENDYRFSKGEGHRVFTHLAKTLLMLGKVQDDLRHFHHEALYDPLVLVVLGGTKCWIEIADVVAFQSGSSEDLLTCSGHAAKIRTVTHRGCDIDVKIITQR